MAMRRVMTLALRRRCCAGLARCISEAGGYSSVAPRIRVNDLQVTPVSFCRFYAKKASKAQKGRAKKVSEEEEDEEEEEMEEVDAEEPRRAAKEHMDAALEALANELSKLRTGRPDAGMLDHVEVEIGDQHVSLSKLAAVSVASYLPKLTVTPFDTTKIKKIEAAIRLSPLDLNPQALDEVITVNIPRLTKEMADSMCKLAAKAGEDTKKSVRRGRQTGMDQLKKMASALSKDDLKRHEKEIDELTKQYVKSVEDACKKKEAEISKGV